MRAAFVQPCIGKEIDEFRITRQCRGATYRFHVKNGNGAGPGKEASAA
jgi:cellobiose phosphorylase